MNAPLKLVKVGNSTGVVLPKSLLARLGVEAGDSLHVVPTEEGVELRRHEADFETQMAVAREIMIRRRRALRELAK